MKMMSGETVAAASTILLSSSVGFICDRKQKLHDSGIIITLLIAIMLSNLTLFGYSVPSSHMIYDLCWSRFLPASLALILFSTANDANLATKNSDTIYNVNQEKRKVGRVLNTREQIIALGFPFIIGSIGSVVGCLIAALIQVKANSLRPLRCIAMNKIDACVAVGKCFLLYKMASICIWKDETTEIVLTFVLSLSGCLSASYIGGTVNFFAAARLISKYLQLKCPTISTTQISNLLSAMAAADLFVMAVYFGTMTKLMSWKRLNTWFPQRGDGPNDDEVIKAQIQSKMKDHSNILTTIPSSISMSILAWLVVEISIFLENKTSTFVPGLGCAFVALFGVLINQTIGLFVGRKSRFIRNVATHFKRDVGIIAPELSEFCFYLLFAAIGTSANLKEAMSFGLGSMTFASMSLLVHIFITFTGSIICMRVAKANNWLNHLFPLSSNEICIASNAAIGGASTAAALAGKSTHNKRNLVVSATFWGIVGYAISTAIGVSLARFLLSLSI